MILCFYSCSTKNSEHCVKDLNSPSKAIKSSTNIGYLFCPRFCAKTFPSIVEIALDETEWFQM